MRTNGYTRYMNTLSQKGFSLVELLVVITILAIISTVAYTSFSGSTDKAKNSKRLENLASIDTALQLYRQKNNHFPLPAASAPTNLWGYNATAASTQTNTAVVVKDSGGAITSLTSAAGGGTVSIGATQIGAKGVLVQSVLGREFLSADIADPIADTKVGPNATLKDSGVGRYVYAVFARPPATGAWNADGRSATAYNLAATILDDQKGAMTRISGDFDDKNSGCSGLVCPTSLI
jgi:prepilin-type N-terminal cleavage/methylation domain-containing protein